MLRQLPDRGVIRGQAIAVCVQAVRAGRYFPGMNEAALAGFRICREPPAAEKAMKQRRLDNHADRTQASGQG